MGSFPPGSQHVNVNVNVLQYNGTTGFSLILAPNENEVIARGQIYVGRGDSMMMMKARIVDFLHLKLPGYCGGFQFVLLLSDVLNRFLSRENEECDKNEKSEDEGVDELNEDELGESEDDELEEDGEAFDEYDEGSEEVEEEQEEYEDEEEEEEEESELLDDDENKDDGQEQGSEEEEESEVLNDEDENKAEVQDMEDAENETIHVRLTSIYLGPTDDDMLGLTNGNPRKRHYPSHPIASLQSNGDTATQPEEQMTPAKRCRREEWQGNTDGSDPVNILTDMISRHLKGFACAPSLSNSAREVALSAYFDWLDNLAPQHPGHFVIVGNPGVGKTTGAWALAEFLAASGIVKKDVVMEAHRDDLVDRFVGGTEMKTNLVIQSACGGVVIFDEIYSLNKQSSPNDTGKDALTTIMKYMTHAAAPVFMFLGYKTQMKDFVNVNPGFQRRIKYTIEMPDYDPPALAQIVRLKLEELNLTIDDDVRDLEGYFFDLNPSYLQLRNASVAISLISHAHAHARKRAILLPHDQRKGVTRVLHKEDLKEALKIIRKESSGFSRCSDPPYGIFM